MKELVDKVKEQWAVFTENTELQVEKGNKAAGMRARKASLELEKLLQGMEERLLTRFKWGLVAELEKPDIELRKNILRNKIKRDGLTIPESVISYIAESVNESVRELEGIVNSLLAQSILFKREIDLDLAQRIVRKAVKCAESKPMTVSDIIAKVCEHYKIDETAIHTKTRKQA